MLRGLFAPAPTEERAQATAWGEWQGDTSTGVQVNTSTAMQLLAVSGCVRLITDSIATLPLDVFREDKSGVRSEIPTPSWLRMPTVHLDLVGFLTQVLSSLLLHGNAYVVVLRQGTAIRSLNPVDPTTVVVKRVNGRKAYLVAGQEFNGEILHIPGLMLPGSDVGLSPLEYARQSITVGLEAQNFARDQFEHMLNMPGVIEAPNVMQPEQMRSMAQMWRQFRSRKGRGLPGVLSGGATFKPTGISNEAAQFLQARQWTAAEIAAQVYLVDPSDLGIPVGGTTLTYANLEQRNLRRVQVTFLPWLVRLEKALSSLLPQPQYVKFNVDGLLRGDTATRWDTYVKAMNINMQAAQVSQPPVLLTSEMREFEDLNIIDEDETPTVPVAEPVADEPQMNAATVPDVNVTVNLPETTRSAEGPHIHLPESVAEPHDLIARTMERTAETLERIETTTSDTLARILDVAEQFDDAVRSIPAPVVNIPEPSKTVRHVERDDNGRIIRVIDEVA